MMDENIACLRTHRNNIARYRRLLQTKLTDLERQFRKAIRGTVGLRAPDESYLPDRSEACRTGSSLRG